ncbi:bi-functional transferase/deacetylase, partial [Streptomyces sp. NPDC051773]
MDAVALYSLVTGTASVPAIAWGVFCIAQLALAAHALRRDGENLRHLWLLPLQQIAYRTALCLVTLHALVTAALGTSPQWHNQSATPAELHPAPA